MELVNNDITDAEEMYGKETMAVIQAAEETIPKMQEVNEEKACNGGMRAVVGQ